MSFPIRCFTCGKCIGQFETRFFTMRDEGKDALEIFEMLNINRYCCRRMFLGHVDYLDKMLKYSKLDEGKK